MRGCSNVGPVTTVHVESHDLVEMPIENPHNVHDAPHEIHMTNMFTSPNHDNPHEMYVPTGSPEMVRRRSNRLNDVRLDVQCHDNYDMGILGKIVQKRSPRVRVCEFIYAQVGPCVWCCGVQVLECRV